MLVPRSTLPSALHYASPEFAEIVLTANLFDKRGNTLFNPPDNDIADGDRLTIDDQRQYHACKMHESRHSYARRVKNLDELGQGNVGTVTHTYNLNSLSTSSIITVTGFDANIGNRYERRHNVIEGMLNGHDYILSFEIKADTIENEGKDFQMRTSSASPGSVGDTTEAITLTDTWQRITHFKFHNGNDGGNLKLWIFGAGINPMSGCLLRNFQTEDATGRLDILTPSEYISTGAGTTLDTELWFNMPDILDAGWIDNGDNTYTVDGSQSGNTNLTKLNILTEGFTYEVTFTLTEFINGLVNITVGAAMGIDRTANGTYTEQLKATDNNDLSWIGDNLFEGTISELTVRRIIYDKLETKFSANVEEYIVANASATLEYEENSTTGFTTIGTGPITLAVNTSDTAHSMYSLQISTSNINDRAIIDLESFFTLVKGATYFLEVDLKFISGNGGIGLWLDETGMTKNNIITTTYLTTRYDTFSLIFVHDATTRFFVAVEGIEDSISVIDNLSIKRINHGNNVDGIKCFPTNNNNVIVQQIVQQEDAYARLTGIAGDFISFDPSPNGVALISSDIDIRLLFRLIGPIITEDFISISGVTQNSFRFQCVVDGTLKLFWSTDGISFLSVATTESLIITPMHAIHVRVTRQAASGDIKFYTSLDGINWIQLGNTVTSTPSGIHPTTLNLAYIGAQNATDRVFDGDIFYLQIFDEIDGITPVLDFNPAMAPRNATFFTSTDGYLYTNNGNAAIYSMGKSIDDEHLFTTGYKDTIGDGSHFLDKLGDELVIDWDFELGGVGWSKGPGWAVIAPDAICDGSQTANTNLQQQTNFGAAGLCYLVTLIINSYATGQVRAKFSIGAGEWRTSMGTFTEILKPTSFAFLIQGDSDFNGSIDSVSVREVILGVDNWTPFDSESLIIDADNNMRIINSDATPASAYQGITTIIGQTYSFWIDFLDIGNAPLEARVGTSIVGDEVYAQLLTATGIYQMEFVAITTTSFINLKTDSTVSGVYTIVRAISVKVANLNGLLMEPDKTNEVPESYDESGGSWGTDGPGTVIVTVNDNNSAVSHTKRLTKILTSGGANSRVIVIGQNKFGASATVIISVEIRNIGSLGSIIQLYNQTAVGHLGTLLFHWSSADEDGIPSTDIMIGTVNNIRYDRLTDKAWRISYESNASATPADTHELHVFPDYIMANNSVHFGAVEVVEAESLMSPIISDGSAKTRADDRGYQATQTFPDNRGSITMRVTPHIDITSAPASFIVTPNVSGNTGIEIQPTSPTILRLYDGTSNVEINNAWEIANQIFKCGTRWNSNKNEKNIAIDSIIALANAFDGDMNSDGVIIFCPDMPYGLSIRNFILYQSDIGDVTIVK